MLVKMKVACIALFLRITVNVKFIVVFITRIFTHPAFILSCKAVFVTAAIFIVKTNAAPLPETIIFFHDRAVHLIESFYESTLLYFSSFTSVYLDVVILKNLVDILRTEVDAANRFSRGLAQTITGILRNYTDLSTSTTSMKKDIDTLNRALESTRRELFDATTSFSILTKTFFEHKKETADRFAAIQKILEKARAPIKGTATAGQVLGSKIFSNPPPKV